MKKSTTSQVLKNDKPLDIRYDSVFKAVFTKDTPESTGALSGLVSALIGRKLSIISINTNEPPPEDTRDRQVRFDISCRAENGERINVEMSFNPDADEPIRLEFFAAKLFIGQDIRGAHKSYDDLKQTYQLAILAKEQFFPDEVYLHFFEYYDTQNQISLNSKTQIITLELTKLDEIVKKETEEMSVSERWAVYFEYLTDESKRDKINEIMKKEEGIAMANQVLMNISRDEVESARLLSEYKGQLDLQSKLVNAERKIAKEIALKMKGMGLTKEQIKQATGLSLETIASL